MGHNVCQDDEGFMVLLMMMMRFMMLKVRIMINSNFNVFNGFNVRIMINENNFINMRLRMDVSIPINMMIVMWLILRMMRGADAIAISVLVFRINNTIHMKSTFFTAWTKFIRN